MLKRLIVPILFFALLTSFIAFKTSLEAEDDTTSSDYSVEGIKEEPSPVPSNAEEELKSIEEKIKKEKFRLNTSKSMQPVNKNDYMHYLLKRKEELTTAPKK